MIWLVNPNYDFPPHPTDRSQAKKSGSNQGLFEGEGHGQIVSIVVCFRVSIKTRTPEKSEESLGSKLVSYRTGYMLLRGVL